MALVISVVFLIKYKLSSMLLAVIIVRSMVASGQLKVIFVFYRQTADVRININ